MYSLTLTYLSAPVARLAAIAELVADPSVEVSVAAIGSKWDDARELPLTSAQLEPLARPRLALSGWSPLGACGLMEWPASLPLGDLLRLCFYSERLGELQVWARVDEIRLQPRKAPRTSSPNRSGQLAAARAA